MVIILFSLYALELAMLFIGMVYVFKLWLQRETVVNEYLSGSRLKWAALIPFGWFIYIYSDAYAVYDLLSGVKDYTAEIDTALKQKALRQALSLIVGCINTNVLIGKLGKNEHR